MNNITIGTDAELFLTHNKKIISSIGLLGGTKDNPKPIGEGCFIQEDNILAEFNIPPVNNSLDFIKYIKYAKDHINLTYPELELLCSSSEIIDNSILVNEKALEFGCEPDCIVDLFEDRDNYTMDEHDQMNIKKASNNLRTAGFHIHIGYDNPNEETNRELVKMFEKYVTMPLLHLDPDTHNRRSMYGKCGSYRHKSYGVECRSLGGYFLKDLKLVALVYEHVFQMLNKFINENERVSKEEFKKIKQIVNKEQTVKVTK